MWFGLRPEVIDDVLAISIFLVGLFLLLSLATHSAGSNLMGALGENVYQLLTFVFGKYVAYVPVLLTLLWGISFWRGRRWRHEPVRVAGGFLAIVFLCAILAIPYANVDFTHDEGFRAGGALGNFLVHHECLDLRNLLGVGGCYLFFITLLTVSLLIAGNISIRQVLARAFASLCAWRPFALSPSPAGVADDEAASPGGSILGRMLRRITSRPIELEESGDDEPLERVEIDSESGQTSRRWMGGLLRRRATPEAEPEDTPELPPDPIATDPLPRKHESRSPAPSSAPPLVESAWQEAPQSPNPEDSASPLVAASERSDDLLTDIFAGDATPEQKYVPPPITIFREQPHVTDPAWDQEIKKLANDLVATLADFGVSARVAKIERGPTVSRIEVEPAPGVKISRITALEADMALAMCAESVRIIAPVPGRGTVGFEIPNKRRQLVCLREIIQDPRFLEHESPLAIALGATTTGDPFIGDLATMPHLLIAGATGSGKSVCLNSIICSILFRMPPDAVKFIMIDPKRVELNVYRDIPHLLAPVVSAVKAAAGALKWAIAEMESRYKELEKLGVRNIAAYNSIVKAEGDKARYLRVGTGPNARIVEYTPRYMPHIVIVIDELADLILTARNEVEDSIVRLAQMSRAVGMHLIIATQRPSVNVITGIIKANFPCRIAFRVAQKIDSRTILDCNGAEALLGRGDMLFSASGGEKPIRLQGCYASDAEVQALTDYLRQQQAPQYWEETFMDEEEGDGEGEAASADEASAGSASARESDAENGVAATGRPETASRRRREDSADDGTDPIDETLLRDAIRVILEHRCASTSLLQRKLRVGFARAGRLMDMMEEMEIVGPSVGPKPRDILVDPDEYLNRMNEED
jgi:S-DNA-T family DNA segregation ATPase FtsK/SpoIIIE